MKNRLVQHDNWATPKEVYDQLNNEFHFDYDPCPLNFEVDGLTCEWGKCNYVNPPYSRKLRDKILARIS